MSFLAHKTIHGFFERVEDPSDYILLQNVCTGKSALLPDTYAPRTFEVLISEDGGKHVVRRKLTGALLKELKANRANNPLYLDLLDGRLKWNAKARKAKKSNPPRRIYKTRCGCD